MKSLRIYFSSIMILLLMVGCAQAGTQPTSQPQPTQIVVTSTLAPTSNGAPTETVSPIPPPTRRPTITAIGNLTATNTPIASLTLAPTSKFTRTAIATITRTSTQFVLPRGFFGGATWTPNKPDFACSFDDKATYPDFMQVFEPREDFVAYWKVINTGKNMWHKDDIIFDYIGGTKMHNDGRGAKILDYTVYKGDSFITTIHMKPPKAPGVYTTSWGFRKTNKKEFFCKLSVTIEVQRKK